MGSIINGAKPSHLPVGHLWIVDHSLDIFEGIHLQHAEGIRFLPVYPKQKLPKEMVLSHAIFQA